MLLISKVISQLLLPPGGLILLAGLSLLFWKRFWARSLLFLVLLTFWFLSTEPVRDMLIKPLEFQYAALPTSMAKQDDTVIVLLGSGIYENAPEYNAQDELKDVAMMRTIYASKLAKRTGLDVYATGGRPLNKNQEAEGDIMRRWLIDFGLNKEHVFSEDLANNTWENATYTKTLLQQKNISKIILVTSGWHMSRSVWCFESQGLTVIPAPTDYLSQQGTYDLRSYLPSADVFYDSERALHEYLGLLFYMLRYGV